MQYMQPRPSSIVAALYTARDLGVRVAILHGPSGCSFKHARLLEEDGMRVLTTSLADHEFIFGAHESLVRVLRYAEKTFAPEKIAVIGTCVSMIIGEDLRSAVASADLHASVISVDIHAGYSENIEGVIQTLEAAEEAGWISGEELMRQKTMLQKANEVERLRGAASGEYIEPSRGDLKHIAASRLIDLIKTGKRGIAVLNAKKETAYIFVDILAALYEVCPLADIKYIVNLEPRGLPKTINDSNNIRKGLEERKLPFINIGALDEYGANGDRIGEYIQDYSPDFALIVGVPHAVKKEYLKGIECFSVTNGPRQVQPLKDQGHAHVIVEIDLHPRSLGITSINPSEFGDVIRSLA